MNNEKDKSLDDLFKKKLQNPDNPFEFMDEDWHSMEEMLDERKKRRGIIYFWPIISGVAAVLLLFFGWWFLNPVNSNNNPKGQKLVEAHPKTQNSFVNKNNPQSAKEKLIVPKEIYAVKSGKTKAGNDSVNSKLTITASSASQKNNNSFTNRLPATNTNPIDKTFSMVSKPARANYGLKTPRSVVFVDTAQPKMNLSIAALSSKIDKNGTTASTEIRVPNKLSVPNSENNTDQQDESKTGKTKEPSTAPVEDSKTAMARLLAKTSTPSNSVVNNKTKTAAKVTASFKPRFASSIMGARDINGVGSFQQAKTGSKAGVLFSAGISRKLTISTGSVYSSTPYEASYGSYNFPYQAKNTPVSVIANCTMLDVPLNIGYQLYHKGKDMVTIGTGLSTYFMLNEQYNFTYASTGYSPGGSATYTVPNSKDYLFKILNFNATYERQISSRAGITLQPYLKLPLADVGYGQVKLETAGIAVGLTWNLSSSKQ